MFANSKVIDEMFLTDYDKIKYIILTRFALLLISLESYLMKILAFCVIDSTPERVNQSILWGSLPYLSIFYRYFHVDCSSELANCMPPPLPRSRCTRLSTSPHSYSVHLPNARVNQYLHFFIPYTGKLWNPLPLSIFPPAYDLNSFKRGVSRQLSH